ncbi:MAG: hypothetical protein AB9903_20300 [Vulcanimicrobiota bacterium]
MEEQHKTPLNIEYSFSMSSWHMLRVALNMLPHILMRIEKDLEESSTIELDLSKLRFITPLSIIPLASLLMNYKEMGHIFTLKEPIDPDCAQYLNTIGFLKDREIQEGLLGRKSFGYIPILHIPSRGPERENLVSSFESLFLGKMGISKGSNFGQTVGYVIDELLANVWEHSRSHCSYLQCQFYPGSEMLELCLADRGVGIADSYRNVGIKIADDESAIDYALNGQSSKSFNDEERGYGIPTVKRIATQSEISGEFLLLSGNAAFWSSQRYEKKYIFEEWCWKGTLLALRLKKNQSIDLYGYVESK